MIPAKKQDESIKGGVIELPGPGITWVGEVPWSGGLGFGDEEGGLRYSDTEWPLHVSTPFKVINSDRPINQIAFNTFRDHKYLAACTASNIAIHRLGEDGRVIESTLFDIGGHGVYATRWGGFLVPLGPGGLAAFYQREDGTIAQNILRHKKPFPYFYSMCRIGIIADGKELWGCAGRSGGLLAITLDEKSIPQVVRCLQSVKKPKDYVGIWALGDEQKPYATISLSRDRQVDFSEDLMDDRTPLTWHALQIAGTAYSLFAAAGNLFIFTSKGIYVGRGLVSQFLAGKLASRQSSVHICRCKDLILHFSTIGGW